MTMTRQDISEGFYAGNTMNIRLTVKDETGQSFSLTGSEVTYALFTDGNVVKLQKSSSNPAQIEIQIAPSTHICIIRFLPNDTAKLSGTYRHMVNVVNPSGEEVTVMTGTIQIFRSHAFRYRNSSRQAFMIGA